MNQSPFQDDLRKRMQKSNQIENMWKNLSLLRSIIKPDSRLTFRFENCHL